MTDTNPTTREALEAEESGEHPDLGRMPDALIEALSGSGMGSDTRAGSLEGGAATGSDDDADQASVDRTMADEGRAEADPHAPSRADPDAVVKTGPAPTQDEPHPAEDQKGREAGPATG